MRIFKIATASMVAALLFNTAGCSLFSQKNSGNAKDSTFVTTLPNFEALDPLYDIGSAGDFEAGLIAYNNKQYSKALAEWYPLAKDNDAKAEYYMGVMYINGQGLPLDLKEGVIWLQQSANRGYADAQYELGQMYISGQGVKQNLDQGARWLLTAARRGHAGAQFNFGLLYQQGKVPLSSNLVAVYKQSNSEDFNFQQAGKWYLAAADQGHGAAQNNLAFLYLHGKGLEQSDDSAFRWFNEAAGQGVADAQYNLGLLYEQGKGSPLDLQEALFWHGKAAANGYLPAKLRLPDLQKLIETFASSLVLYADPLSLTTRQKLREKLKGHQAYPLREQSNYWFDIYESSKLLQQTDRLYVGYSLQTGQVASLKYRFPSFNDASYVLSVIEMISEKYGQPATREGDLNFGLVDYRWDVKDTVVKVTRHWPDTTVYLSYQVGNSYQQMVSEMPKNADELQYNIMFETY